MNGFDRARDGLAVWLRSLRASSSGEVLVSAQICPAVRYAIAAAGLTPRYVDIDESFATPSPSQYTAAINRDTAAIIVAPFYGYVQSSWDALRTGSIPVCLDMAQGLLLEERLAPLIDRAAALLYSFSLGKGLDLGGAVLCTRAPLGGNATPARVLRSGAALNNLVLRTIIALGLYPMVLPYIERAVNEEQQGEAVDAGAPVRDVRGHRDVWAARAVLFAGEVDRARESARRITMTPAFTAACRDVGVYGDRGASHLRQVIRLRDPLRRADVLHRLRSRGVDCSPAGEPLPADHAPADFPNAFRFVSDAIRLPFLGRLDARKREHVERAIEAALA